MKYLSKSLLDTETLAKDLSEKITPGSIVLLNGNLGAGKTTFVKFFAKHINIDSLITSPTFTFVKNYVGKYNLHHFDLYRIEDEDEIKELGLEEYLFDEQGVCMIEWNKFTNFPKKPIKIDILYLDDNTREFNIEGI